MPNPQRQLVLLGSGGFAREVAAAVVASNHQSDQWDLLGYLDDRNELHHTELSGFPVLGPLEWILDKPDVSVVACMGNPANFRSKRQVVDRLDLSDDRFATIIHPLASIGHDCVVGAGSVVLAGTVLTADVIVGKHVGIMPLTLLTHEDRVGDFASLTGGVKLAGRAKIEEGAYIGAATIVDAGVTIGAWSQVGAGSYVRQDIPAGEVWWGTPATFRRKTPGH